MPDVTRPGGPRIHYQRHGAPGRPVVMLLQGMSLSGRYWMEVPAELVASGHEVLVPDQRGTGSSGRPLPPYRIADMAADAAAVLEHAGVSSVVVVGMSLGGMVAQELALRFPARVAGLVLLSTTAGLPHGSLPTPAALATLGTLPLLGAGTSSHAVNRLMLGERHAHRAPELFRGWGPAMAADPVVPSTFMAHLGAAALHSTGFRLPSLRMPVFVGAGGDDRLIPPRNAHVLASLVPGARLEVVPDAGHAVTALDRGLLPRGVAEVLRRAPVAHASPAAG